MEIESIPFESFKNLTGCAHALDDPENHGCQWYVASDRRVAGRIFLDPDENAFRFSVLRSLATGWKVREPSYLYEHFHEAETALRSAMRREATGKEVTLTDVPAKMRFGKGRTRDAQSDGEPA